MANRISLWKGVKPSLVGWMLFLVFIQVFANRWISDPSFAADYRSFYAAGYLARTDPGHLYDLNAQKRVQDERIAAADVSLPYFHPAAESLLYAPFTLLPFRQSYRVFLLFNVVLLAAACWSLQELSASRLPLLRRNPGIRLFTFAPVIVALVQGQDSVLSLLLCCLAWRSLQQGKRLTAGLVLGTLLFRPQLALPLAALLSLRWGSRFLCGFVLSASGLLLTSAALVGRGGFPALLHLLSSGSLATDQGAAAQRLMAIYPRAMPNLLGLLYAAGTWRWQPTHAAVLVLVLSGALLGWCAYLCRRLWHAADVFAVAVLCSILVSYHLYLHDLTLLVVPLALLHARFLPYVEAATYAAAYVILFYVGAGSYYLLAIPVALLIGLATGKLWTGRVPASVHGCEELAGQHAAGQSAAGLQRAPFTV